MTYLKWRNDYDISFLLEHHHPTKMVRSTWLFLLFSAFALTLCYLLISNNLSANQKQLMDVPKRKPLKSFQEPLKGIRPDEAVNHELPNDQVAKNTEETNLAPDGARLNLIIQYPIFNRTIDDDWAVQRQKEVTYCLQQNLLSPHVEKVHILSESEHHASYVKSLNLSMAGKLVFQTLGRRVRYKDSFLYASMNLIGKNGMIMNADCYVGKGFEHLDNNILRKKTMYSLTRHGPPAKSGLCSVPDMCGPNYPYQGSHDAWVFRLLSPLPDEVLDHIDYMPHLGGIEQVLMFYFRTSGGFTIKNPCKILHIVHYHCLRTSKLGDYQSVDGIRIDHRLGLGVGSKGNLVLAGFSDL